MKRYDSPAMDYVQACVPYANGNKVPACSEKNNQEG